MNANVQTQGSRTMHGHRAMVLCFASEWKRIYRIGVSMDCTLKWNGIKQRKGNRMKTDQDEYERDFGPKRRPRPNGEIGLNGAR